MSDTIKIKLLLPFMAALAAIGIYMNVTEAKRFEAEGTIVEARWNTKNHQMSLFKIKTGSNVLVFHHQDVILQPSQIKVGDYFSKKSGSNICTINYKQVQCVR